MRYNYLEYKRFVRNPIFSQIDENLVKFRRWINRFYDK